MRRRHLEWWPALSRVYGVHPWDVERLTPAELAAYQRDYNALAK